MDLFIALLLAPGALGASLYLAFRLKRAGLGAKPALMAQIAVFFISLVFITTAISVSAVAADADTASEIAAATADKSSVSALGVGMIAAALAVGIAGIGSGIAVAASAPSAMGAISENEKLFGKALIYVAMAEGIAIYGLLVAILIIFTFR